MEAEARLLEELVAIPQITKATVRAAAAGSGAQVTVQSAQHNLPANAKRQLVRAVHVPDPSRPGDVFAPALPVELPPMDLQSVSPSGARCFVPFGCVFVLFVQASVCTLHVRSAGTASLFWRATPHHGSI
jgi:hypothetical protein